jgi:hypothetical protein
MTRLRELLQLDGGHVGNRDAVVMAELDHRIAVRVRGDERRQLLRRLDIGEVIELDRVVLGIEVDDGVKADVAVSKTTTVTMVGTVRPGIEKLKVNGPLLLPFGWITCGTSMSGNVELPELGVVG